MKIIQRKLILLATCVVVVLVFRPAKEIFHRYADQCLQALQFHLQKKGPRLLIAASVDVLPRGSGDFGHDPSLGKFSVFTRSFLKGAQN